MKEFIFAKENIIEYIVIIAKNFAILYSINNILIQGLIIFVEDLIINNPGDVWKALEKK